MEILSYVGADTLPCKALPGSLFTLVACSFLRLPAGSIYRRQSMGKHASFKLSTLRLMYKER
jgi:hypothetical protein